MRQPLYLCFIMSKALIPTYDICSLALGKPASEDLLIARFSEYLEGHKDIRFPHRHSFYHLAFFTGGGGSHTIDFERFPVKAGQLYFMVPGQVHSWFFSGKIEGYVMNVSAAFFNAFLQDDNYVEKFPFFSGVSAEGVVQLPKQDIPVITALFENMLTEINKPAAYGVDMLRLLTLEMFIKVGRATNPAAGKQELPHNYLLLRNFRKLVEQNYMLGKSAGEIIRDRVLLEAKRLLTNADMSIATIAWQLNFADNSYFTKFFKKYTGQTPEDFRKHLA